MLGTGRVDTGAKWCQAVKGPGPPSPLVAVTISVAGLLVSFSFSFWFGFFYLKHNLLALVVPSLLKSSVLPCAAALMGTVAGKPAMVARQCCWGKPANKPANISVLQAPRQLHLLEDCRERKPMCLSASFCGMR